MPKGKRQFVLSITETEGLTEGELTGALSRVAGQIKSGRLRIESGIVRDSTGKIIGGYRWVSSIPVPSTSTSPTSQP